MSEQGTTKDLVCSDWTAHGGYYSTAHPEAKPAVDLERIRRLEIEAKLGPPDNYMGRRDLWLQEQQGYTLMQADAMWALLELRKAKP